MPNIAWAPIKQRYVQAGYEVTTDQQNAGVVNKIAEEIVKTPEFLILGRAHMGITQITKEELEKSDFQNLPEEMRMRALSTSYQNEAKHLDYQINHDIWPPLYHKRFAPLRRW